MKIAACLTVRNEDRYIIEWLAYHFVVGFDTLIVFNNRSTDSTQEILAAASGVRDVRVINWPFTHPDGQTDAYLAACKEFGREFDWIGFIDSDEFILPLKHADVKEWLSTIKPDAAAVGVPWAIFGSSGHLTQPKGLIIENYLQRAPDSFPPNAHIKSFVRPSRVKAVVNPHFFSVDGSYVDPIGLPLSFNIPGLMDRSGDRTTCHVRHYMTRSRQDWERRLLRGRFASNAAQRSWADFDKYNRNDLFDDTILRFADRTRIEMSRFSDLTGLAQPSNTVTNPAAVGKFDFQAGTSVSDSPLIHREGLPQLDRKQEILKHIALNTFGVEIAPWFSPIIPVGSPRRAIVLDVLDRKALVSQAHLIPTVDDAAISQICEVDIVGSACEIAELAGARFGADARFDFVVSSHNLEHLPDPVRFLRGCESLLKPGGMVAMAVPDKRACFDYFRPHSSTGELLQAFHERRERPSFAQTFSQSAYAAKLRVGDKVTGAFSIDIDPTKIVLVGDIVGQYASWLARIDNNDTRYTDTHCWTFTPSSLELILTELVMLKLIDFDIVCVTETSGCEFFVHLRKRPNHAEAQTGLAERRALLLQQTTDELGHSSRHARNLCSANGQDLSPQATMISKVSQSVVARDATGKTRVISAPNIEPKQQVLSPTTSLQPAMTRNEQYSLVSFLKESRRYLEFGTGGSTLLAVAHVRGSVTSVDSSEIWLDKVAQACCSSGGLTPSLVHADIGPVRELGYPKDETFKARWPAYVSTVWEHPQAAMSDLCLIDGRFRVASFISVLLHCSPMTTIMIHDFPERPYYHVVRQFADEIACTDTLVVFRPKADFSVDHAMSVLGVEKFNPA